MLEIDHIDSSRVRTLCNVSEEHAHQICSNANVADSPVLHCARFTLHILRGVKLEEGYAWNVLQAFSQQWRLHRGSIASHVSALGMYAADLDSVCADPVEWLRAEDYFVCQAAICRFALSEKALTDERILELSFSESNEVKRSLASVLAWRDSPHRNQILRRLIGDPSPDVSVGASLVAGRTKHPELLDLLWSKDALVPVAHAGDRRGQSYVEALANSDQASDRRYSVLLALLLEDRQLLSRLCEDHDWEVRSYALIVCVSEGVFDLSQMSNILTKDTPAHLLDLMVRWPKPNREALRTIAGLLSVSTVEFASIEALVEGQSLAVDRARASIPFDPKQCGAMLRLFPKGISMMLAKELLASPQDAARVIGVHVIGRQRLTELFPLVAEVCLDPSPTVAAEAAQAITHGHMRCGVHGLDTAILAAGDDFRANLTQRMYLRDAIESILGDKSEWS